MAKALRTAAFVVGAAALVATGVGAAVGAGVLGATAAGATTATFLGVAAATFTAIGAIAGVAGAVLSYAASAAAPKASVGGNATKFTIDKDSGYPYAMGRTYSGGKVVHRQFYGSKNEFESWVTAHSLGPIRSMSSLEIDKVPTISGGGGASGQYAGFMWLDDQLGACPEARALQGPFVTFPGWEDNNKLSGIAADCWTLKYDSKGKVYPNGVPQRGRVIEGVFVYDPRQDSTYPGGAGACRLGVESSYVYSENPALHAITWAFGRYQSGVLIAGGGLDVVGIDMQPFVEWANACDLNGWKVGGVVYTAEDDSWDVLKMIAQAGGGEVMPVSGMLSCTFSAPRVSIGSIRSEDIIGDVDVPGSASRRQRRNTVIPRVRLESHGWEVVPLEPVAVPDFVAVDGGSRPKEISYPLVQDVDQGTQLGLYDMINARELDGIVLPCKVYAVGYRPGDCLTLDIPEANLIARDVIVRSREIDGSTMGVTLTCRSETASKHPFCLGKSGKAPPTPDLSVPPSYSVDTAALQLAISTSFPIGLGITAAAGGTITLTDHVRRYTDGHPDVAVYGATIVFGLPAGTFRAIGYDDDDRIGGTVSYQLFADDIDARASPQHPGRHYIGYVIVPEAGSPPASGGGATPPGGRCVTDDTLIWMANAEHTGPGEWKPAREVAVGDWVWTAHEHTLEFGAFQVIASEFARAKVMRGGDLPRATAKHKFWLPWSGWTEMASLGEPDGEARVWRGTVDEAHTYFSRATPTAPEVLSHNIKATDTSGE